MTLLQDAIVTLVAAAAAISIIVRAIKESLPATAASSPCGSCPARSRKCATRTV